MKSASLISLIFVIGCASTHRTPSESRGLDSYEYCDGELWGYMIPLGPREPKSWWSRNFDDPMPLMAAFLHMRSNNERTPERALTLHLAIRSRVDFSIQIPEQMIEVQIDGKASSRFPVRFVLMEEFKSAKERFPYPKYESKLIDASKNEWSIARRNQLVYFIKETPMIVRLPNDQSTVLGARKAQIKFDAENMKQIWVLAEQNIWPPDQDLRNAKVSIQIPKIIINDGTIPGRLLVFEMNYEGTQKKRTRSNARQCPSTSRLFQRND